MIFHINQSSGVPVYLQLMEQVRHAVETGALRPGDQLPAIRKLAGDLVINPNTVVRAYRDLEHEKVVELKQGSGAFISESVARRTQEIHKGQKVVQSAMERLKSLGLSEEEIRRLVESELATLHAQNKAGSSNE
jgi:GntR family transcriptional regulator